MNNAPICCCHCGYVPCRCEMPGGCSCPCDTRDTVFTLIVNVGNTGETPDAGALLTLYPIEDSEAACERTPPAAPRSAAANAAQFAKTDADGVARFRLSPCVRYALCGVSGDEGGGHIVVFDCRGHLFFDGVGVDGCSVGV